MSLDTVAARTQALINEARCRGCGTTLAECRRICAGDSEPIACCGLHDHPVSITALQRLADEAKTGAVTAPRPKPVHSGLPVYPYLNQGDRWYPKPPAAPVRIADMDATWRYNAARFLLRAARSLAWRYGFGELALLSGPFGPQGDMATMGAEEELVRADKFRLDDPQGWMRTTALYQALTAGLPGDPSRLYRLAQRARHWSACPAREHNAADCSCGARPLDRSVPVLVTTVGRAA